MQKQESLEIHWCLDKKNHRLGKDKVDTITDEKEAIADRQSL